MTAQQAWMGKLTCPGVLEEMDWPEGRHSAALPEKVAGAQEAPPNKELSGDERSYALFTGGSWHVDNRPVFLIFASAHVSFHFSLLNYLISTSKTFSMLFSLPCPDGKGNDRATWWARGIQSRSNQHTHLNDSMILWFYQKDKAPVKRNIFFWGSWLVTQKKEILGSLQPYNCTSNPHKLFMHLALLAQCWILFPNLFCSWLDSFSVSWQTILCCLSGQVSASADSVAFISSSLLWSQGLPLQN